MEKPKAPPLASRVASAWATVPAVEGVALSGSLGAGNADAASDVDLYVYHSSPVSLGERKRIAASLATEAEVGNDFFEPGDEWIDPATGIGVDVMFRDLPWIEDRLAAVLVRHEASVGYTTALWHNVLTSTLLYDRSGRLARLLESARAPYPEPLRRAIVAKNHPLLRRNQSSYARQIERAVERGDAIAVNHRVAALLSSFFDVLFAVNRIPHPGEKRLASIASARCGLLPESLDARVEALLGIVGDAVHARGAARAQAAKEARAKIDRLVDGLDTILAAEGLLVAGPPLPGL